MKYEPKNFTIDAYIVDLRAKNIQGLPFKEEIPEKISVRISKEDDGSWWFYGWGPLMVDDVIICEGDDEPYMISKKTLDENYRIVKNQKRGIFSYFRRD